MIAENEGKTAPTLDYKDVERVPISVAVRRTYSREKGKMHSKGWSMMNTMN